MKTYEKLDDNTLKITSIPTPPVIVETYNYPDLVSYVDSLVAEKDAFNLAQDAKIADARKAVKQAEDLGILKVPSEVKSVDPLKK
jgi:hypothetical protein